MWYNGSMKYLYWVLGAVVAGGLGVAGYYYGPDLLGTSTRKDIESSVSQPENNTDIPPSNNWDLLIQAAKAGRNAELVTSVLMSKHLLFQFEIFGTNRYKISNVASNGDVTFEYEVLSVDVQLPDKVKQDMLKDGYTVPDEDDAVMSLEQLGIDTDKMIGYTQKGIFTKDAFISMIEDWKVGSFAVGNWGSRDDSFSSSSPSYITSLTVQCKNNDWDCLIEAADAGNNARMVASSQIEKQSQSFGITRYPTNECKVGHVASNGDVDFGYMMTAVRVQFDRDFKNKMVAEGKTGIDIEQYKKELEAGLEGWLDGTTLTKNSFRALIGHWKGGNFSILDLENYRQLGAKETQSSSLDNAPTSMHSEPSSSKQQSLSMQEFVINDISMEPTISNGASLSVDASEQAISNLKRGDIIRFLWPKNVAIWFVKRIVGMPGESIEIRSGSVFINGKKLSEPYLKAGETTPTDVKRDLGNNEYFVMGDNRSNSSDSRLWGPVGASYIRGKVVSWDSSSPNNASTDHFIDGSMIGL